MLVACQYFGLYNGATSGWRQPDDAPLHRQSRTIIDCDADFGAQSATARPAAIVRHFLAHFLAIVSSHEPAPVPGVPAANGSAPSPDMQADILVTYEAVDADTHVINPLATVVEQSAVDRDVLYQTLSNSALSQPATTSPRAIFLLLFTLPLAPTGSTGDTSWPKRSISAQYGGSIKGLPSMDRPQVCLRLRTRPRLGCR